MVTIELHIKPRAAFRPYLLRAERFACLVCHRRAGKTYSCLQDILARALTFSRPGPPLRYGYIAPTRDQAKDIAWGYLQKFTEKLPGVKANQQELSLRLPNDSQIRLYSGDSYDRMRGLYFDGVVIDEPADIDGDAWPMVIRPCLSDYNGWATFIGTPKGKNAFYSRHVEAMENPEKWFSLVLRASESGIIAPDELASLKADMPRHAYAQEYECDFSVPMPGAIYASAIEQARAEARIGKFPLADALVHTSWDLGAPANTSVWYWQVVGPEIRVIDADIGVPHETITKRVAAMMAKGYSYGSHFLPPDAMQTSRTGTTFATEAAAAGLTSIKVVPVTQDIWMGINALQGIFPALAFRMPQCERGIEALSSYRTKQVQEGEIIRNEPVRDWASHAADALRTMAEAVHCGMVKTGATLHARTLDEDDKPRRRGQAKFGFVGARR